MKKDSIFNGAEINKEAFLLDGLEYYTVDPKKRRCIVGAECQYSPSDTSIGCFIGKHLDSETSKDFDKSFDFGGEDISGILKGNYNKPEWINKNNIGFLFDCQNLHDEGCFWGESNLSNEGKTELQTILNDHHISKDKFKKYL